MSGNRHFRLGRVTNISADTQVANFRAQSEKLVAELSKFQALPSSKPKPFYILAVSPELFLFSP